MVITSVMTSPLFCNFLEALSTLRNSIFSITINFPQTEMPPLNNMVMMLTVQRLRHKETTNQPQKLIQKTLWFHWPKFLSKSLLASAHGSHWGMQVEWPASTESKNLNALGTSTVASCRFQFYIQDFLKNNIRHTEILDLKTIPWKHLTIKGSGK